jgi:GTP-binding protein
MKAHAKFVISAASVPQFPTTGLPEVAFLGRSNVGKSSVLNSLVGEKIARTSSTPGRTRTINFFEIRRAGQPRPELLFADLPGYGYARLPRAVTAEWPSFIEPYLLERRELMLCVALVDARIAAQQSDKELLTFLRESRRAHVVVATKADRLSGNELRNSLRKLAGELGVEALLPFSSKSGAGHAELWRAIWAAAAREQTA